MRRTERRRRALLRRALMRGRREAHRRGLNVRGVLVNAMPWGPWEAWHVSDPFNNLREFYDRSMC